MAFQIPLKLTVFQLIERFTLLWPSIHEAISAYATSMPVTDFWEVYQMIINLTTEKINLRENKNPINEPTIFGFLRHTTGDFDSFRIQLFKTMQLFVNVIERKNKDIVETLIALYRFGFHIYI